MRRKLIPLLALCMLLFSGCVQNTRNSYDVPDNYSVGIIRTNGSRNSSDILYFDANLSQTGSIHYDYATMGELFYPPVIYDGSLYIVPQGQANKKDEKTILRQDLDTFEQNEYYLDQIAIYGLSVDASAIFAANNINQQSFINRIDRADGTVKAVTYDNSYISIVYSYQDKLYAFSSQSTPSGKNETLHCLDPITLEELKRIDISEFGCDVYSVTGVGDTLYFAPMVTSQDTFNQIVCAYDISTEEISTIKFSDDVFHLLNMDDKLYVTHGNLVTGEGTTLSVYEISTGKIDTYDLGVWIGQIAINDDYLYLMGTGRIAKYDLHTMKKEMETEIPLENGDYLSGIFTH